MSLRANDILGLVGFGLTIGLFFLVYFSEVLYLPAAETQVMFLLYRLFGLLSFAVSFFVVRRLSDKLSTRKAKSSISRTALALGSLLPFVYALQMILEDSIILPAVIAWVASGVSMTLLYSLWAEYSSMLPLKSAMPTLTLAYALGGAWYLIIACLEPFVVTITLLASLLFSILLFYVFSRESALPEIISLDESRMRVELSRFTEFAICWDGLIFGLLLQNILINAQASESRVVIPVGLLVTCCILAVALIFLKDRLVSFSAAQRLVFPLVVMGVLAFPITDGIAWLVCAGFLVAVLMFFDISNWTTLAVLSSRYRAQPIYHFMRGRASYVLGLFFGWALGMLLNGYIVASIRVPDILVSFVLVSLLAVSVAIVPFGFDTLTMKRALDARDDDWARTGSKQVGAFRNSCIKVSEQFELTPREREVFFLLAKGRNAAIVEKELIISMSTVKSHMYSIYRKLGVSSQQELIDVVEEDVRDTLRTPKTPNANVS